ncbi:hypothetical protein A4X09_0g5632 [Tilletia walkeri]|uniref:DUF6589 domain-containing protein n=1 Tax=Tilletia walkeri TaxID=117179 RepID=A0A8X7N5F0_9BASI|nr:hypothetical protein A4X09_0g5632 [Tilletia walkeri]
MQNAFQTILRRRRWRTTLEHWSPADADSVKALVDETSSLLFSRSEIDGAIARHDDVGANARLFMRDAAMGFEFKNAVKFGDVGRMHEISKLLVLGFAGSRKLQYADALLDEIWAKEVLSANTWRTLAAARLVNRFGLKGGFIGADLFQEHLNREIRRVNMSHSREGLVDRLVEVFSAAADLARSALEGHPQLFGSVNSKRGRKEGEAARNVASDICSRLSEADGLFEAKTSRVSGKGLNVSRRPRKYPEGVPSAQLLCEEHEPISSARDLMRSGHHYLEGRGLRSWQQRRDGEARQAAFMNNAVADLTHHVSQSDSGSADGDDDGPGTESSDEGEQSDDGIIRMEGMAAFEALRRRAFDRRQMDIDIEDSAGMDL